MLLGCQTEVQKAPFARSCFLTFRPMLRRHGIGFTPSCRAATLAKPLCCCAGSGLRHLAIARSTSDLGLYRLTTYILLAQERHFHRVPSSVVEQLTADQQVSGSNPEGPFGKHEVHEVSSQRSCPPMRARGNFIRERQGSERAREQASKGEKEQAVQLLGPCNNITHPFIGVLIGHHCVCTVSMAWV